MRCTLGFLRSEAIIKHLGTTYAKATLILTNKVRKRLLVATTKRFVLSFIKSYSTNLFSPSLLNILYQITLISHSKKEKIIPY